MLSANELEEAHPAKLPLMLQDHGNLVSFPNIWIRELASIAEPAADGNPQLQEGVRSLLIDPAHPGPDGGHGKMKALGRLPLDVRLIEALWSQVEPELAFNEGGDPPTYDRPAPVRRCQAGRGLRSVACDRVHMRFGVGSVTTDAVKYLRGWRVGPDRPPA